MSSEVGKRVIIHGVVAKPELNGKKGTCISYDAERGRIVVRLDAGDTVSLKPNNVAEEINPEIAIGVPAVVANGVAASGIPANGIAGNGSDWAVDRVRQFVGTDEVLLGVWQISERNRGNMTKQACAPLVLPPCWPIAVCCAPCVCVTCDTLKSIHGGTIYALTESSIWRLVEADPYQGDCMGLPLIDRRAYASGSLPLAAISSIAVGVEEGTETSIDRCFPTQQVLLGVPPGNGLATERSEESPRFKDRMALYVDEPVRAAACLPQVLASRPPHSPLISVFAARPCRPPALLHCRIAIRIAAIASRRRAPRIPRLAQEAVAALIHDAKGRAPSHLAGSALLESLFASMGGGMGSGMAAPGAMRMDRGTRGAEGVRDALEQLEELLGLGLISRSEYDAKRAELLAGI